MSDATVHINKIAASGRQLDAAIRMFFSREDELAIHTVAAAAFRVLRDLNGKRGRDFTADVLRNSVVVLAREYARGTLPEETRKLIENTPLMEAIKTISENIKSLGDAFDPTTIKMHGVNEQRAWPSKSANFLKHADRDPDDLLALSDINNERLLIGSAVAYLQLMQTATPEMMAYMAYWGTKSGSEYDLPNDGKALASSLVGVGDDQQFELCLSFIKKQKSKSN